MVSIVLVVLMITFYPLPSFGWNNRYDEKLRVVCSGNRAVSSIYSKHDNGREDRVFSIGCRSTSGQKQWCYWSGWVNRWDGFFSYQCPRRGIIHGMKSIHDNGKEDRLWQFYCCERKGYTVADCYNTQLTDWDAYFSVYIPYGKVMRGVTSAHDNGKEDRVYSFQICSLKRKMRY